MRATSALIVCVLLLLTASLGQKAPAPVKPAQPVSQPATDDEIHKCIDDKVAGSDLKNAGITVTVKNGLAELAGKLTTRAQKSAAQEAARSCHARKTTIRVISR